VMGIDKRDFPVQDLAEIFCLPEEQAHFPGTYSLQANEDRSKSAPYREAANGPLAFPR
jgi:hypothetical protein